MTIRGTFQQLRPLSLLNHLSSCYDSAHFQVFSNSVSWSIWLKEGKIIYASDSVEPIARLERHLKRLSSQLPQLQAETWSHLRSLFAKNFPEQSILSPDYQAICWLVNQKYLNSVQAAVLIEEVAKEVIASLLLVKSASYELEAKPDAVPEFCCLEVQPLVEYCQQHPQIYPLLDSPSVKHQQRNPAPATGSSVVHPSKQQNRRPLVYLLLAAAIGIGAAITHFIYPYIQLNRIKSLQVQANYPQCINQAKQAAKAHSSISHAAQTILNQCLMGYAESLAKQGKLLEAMSVAQKISKNSPLYPKAQKHLKEWSEI